MSTTLLTRAKYTVHFEALAGETECGDQFFVKELPDSLLIAVVDGLGHGPEAAYAAKKVIALLDRYAAHDLVTLVEICDQELITFRGVALTIARFTDDHLLSYLAIGNVTGVCWQLNEESQLTSQSLFLRGGIVGGRLPHLDEKKISIKSGDILILATDGIDNKFEIEPPKLLPLADISSLIFAKYRNVLDDGLILVMQFL